MHADLCICINNATSCIYALTFCLPLLTYSYVPRLAGINEKPYLPSVIFCLPVPTATSRMSQAHEMTALVSSYWSGTWKYKAQWKVDCSMQWRMPIRLFQLQVIYNWINTTLLKISHARHFWRSFLMHCTKWEISHRFGLMLWRFIGESYWYSTP